MKRMFYFDVTVRVAHEGRPIDVSLTKGARAADGLTARRAVLGRFLDRGFQVLRLEPVAEGRLGGRGPR